MIHMVCNRVLTAVLIRCFWNRPLVACVARLQVANIKFRVMPTREQRMSPRKGHISGPWVRS